MLELPFFVGVVYRDKGYMKIYSCQQLLNLSLKYGNLADSDVDFEVELKPIDDYSKENGQNNLFKLMSYPKFENLLSDNKNILINEKKQDKKNIKQITLEIGPKISKICLGDTNLEERKNQINQLKEWISLDYTNKYNEKTYVPIPIIKFCDNEIHTTHYIEYYNPVNYELNIYHYLAIRLAMLFLHFSKNETLLQANKEIIINSEKLINLILSKLVKGDIYYKQHLKILFELIEFSCWGNRLYKKII